MSRTIVGVDLGTRAVKVAVCEAGRIVRICCFEDLSGFDPGAGENGVLLTWLGLFVRENGLAGCPAAIGFPGERLFPLPLRAGAQSRRAEIRESILAMASLRKEFPFPDPVLDAWEVGPPSEEGRPILAVVASRASLAARAEGVRKAGLVPMSLEPDLAALARVLAVPPEEGRVVLDIGAEHTRIALVAEGRLVHLTSVGFGVGSALGTLAADEAIPTDAAASRLLDARGSEGPDPATDEALEPIYRRIRNEVLRTVGVHGPRTGFPALRSAAAIGSGARILAVERILAGSGLALAPLELDIPGGLPRQLDTGESTAEELPRVAVAAGLARRGEKEPGAVNLLVASAVPERRREGQRLLRHPLVAPAAALLLALLGQLVLGARVEGLERQRSDRQARLGALRSDQDRSAGQLQARVEAMETVLRKVESDLAPFPECLIDIGRSAGPGLKVERIEVVRGPREQGEGAPASDVSGRLQISISGTAQGSKDVRQFLARLGESRFLRSIQIRVLRSQDRERSRASFEIGAEIGAPEESR